jgi:hypothetical protein
MIALTADQLAAYRGCVPANACYQSCLQAAQARLDDPVAAQDPDELPNAARWAARLDWPAPSNPDTRHLNAGADGEDTGTDGEVPAADGEVPAADGEDQAADGGDQAVPVAD